VPGRPPSAPNPAGAHFLRDRALIGRLVRASGAGPGRLVLDLGAGRGAYFLLAASPAIDAGRTVTDALRGMGLQDCSGASIPQRAGFDIGAYEYRFATPDPAATRFIGLTRREDAWQVQFLGTSGRSYAVQASRDLSAWEPVATAAEFGAGVFTCVDQHQDMVRFYRAVARGLPGL